MGSSVFEDIKRWEEEDPDFRKKVDEHIEKVKLGKLLKSVREKEHITQAQLAQIANISQSVIARIETGTSKTLPRIDLFNRILKACGYEFYITAKKGEEVVEMVL